MNVPIDTIFSIIKTPEGVEIPTGADFIQPDVKHIATRLKWQAALIYSKPIRGAAMLNK